MAADWKRIGEKPCPPTCSRPFSALSLSERSMTPVYLNQPAHSLPLADHSQKEYKNHLFTSPTNHDPTSSISCPSSCISEDSRARDIGKQRHDQEPDTDDWSSVCGPKDREEMNRSSSSHKDLSAKWKCSSEMWLMQKTKPNTNTSPDSSSTDSHKASNYSPTWQRQRRSCNYKYNNSDNINRVCADCSTTSTPLWRSGPNGPKSLCNACGIRQRKARKAMEEAGNGLSGWCSKTRIVQNNKEKKRKLIKNRSQCRGKRKVGLQDSEFSLSRNSVFQ